MVRLSRESGLVSSLKIIAGRTTPVVWWQGNVQVSGQ